MQKRRGADDLIENHERSRHQRARFIFLRSRKSDGVHLIGEDRFALPDSFGSDGAFLRTQSNPDEALGHLAFGLVSDKFIRGMTPPEINSRDLKKLARGAAEKFDQSSGVGAFVSLRV